MNGFRYLKNVVTLELDQGQCVDCGRCAQVCPHQVFLMESGKTKVNDLDVCMECGACANCPKAAIKVDAGVGCASGIISQWLVERGIKQTGNECCS